MRQVLSACLGIIAMAGPVRGDLPGYVAKSDSAFRWEIKGKADSPLGAVYDIHLVSQVWQGITWEHSVQVHVPPGVTPTAKMLLWNTGGKPNAASAAFGLTLAAKIRAPVAFLYGIPNQPLFDGKKEDALIAETFVRYLQTQNEDWPLLFPMVKSLVRAMDALQAFALAEWKQPVSGFVVSGASKRGWTTWLTAAVDHRVKAIAPLVIDTLNIPAQLPHQIKSFGKYSDQIRDYTARGLVPLPAGDAARKLWQMTDPFTYRESLTMPKLIINGANDPYWTLEALNFYWDGLKGDKWVCYVPNAGHNLERKVPDGRPDRAWAVDSLAAFARAQIHGESLPTLTWKHDDADGKARLSVNANPAPRAATLWVVDSATRDFRNQTWHERSVNVGDSQVSASVEPPDAGFRAFFLECDYPLDGLTCRLSTQVRVIERR